MYALQKDLTVCVKSISPCKCDSSENFFYLVGAIPRLRSGGAAVRRYPSSKVRSSGYALLEQP